ncbi:MAG TPA: hypothetical protein DDW52_17540 [Planctomycetaceae bacterium]|nr:hypothetical protein [Planctomycetaceae bacterium]
MVDTLTGAKAELGWLGVQKTDCIESVDTSHFQESYPWTTKPLQPTMPQMLRLGFARVFNQATCGAT